MQKESNFIWACPKCEREQTEIVTIDGPVMSLICAGCDEEFDDTGLPEPIRQAWWDAIDRVIPKDEVEDERLQREVATAAL